MACRRRPPRLGQQVPQAVTGAAGERVQVRTAGGDEPCLLLLPPGSLIGGTGKDDQAGADLIREPGDFRRRQVAGQVMDKPAILPEAGSGHQRGQAGPFPGRGGHDRRAAGPPRRLPDLRSEQPLADRACPVLLGDGDPASRPLVANTAQRRRDDLLAQVNDAHPGCQPLYLMTGPRFLAPGDRRIQRLRLGCPVPDMDGPGRLAALPPLRRKGLHAGVADLIAAPTLQAGSVPSRTQA